MARQRFQLRRDTAASWAAANPILLAGEAGYELDAKRLKIGDGVSTWSQLPYFADETNSLGSLIDVDTTGVVDGSLLIYDAATGQFVANQVNTKLTIVDGANF